MTTKKPEIEQFIEAFNASSTRTRTLLIGLLFASILSFIAVIDSMHSWYGSRIEIRQVALQWFNFPEDNPNHKEKIVPNQVGKDSLNKPLVVDKTTTDTAFHSIEDFAHALEQKEMNPKERLDSTQIQQILHNAINLECFTCIGENNSDLPYWITLKPFESVGARAIPTKKERKNLYKVLSRAAAYANDYSPHSKEEYEYALENLMEAQTENFTLLRMPILGVSFDINYLGLISGIIMYSLMALLYLSMVREDRNLKTLFGHGWKDEETDNRRLYELLSMYQVLTVPQKLYRPDNRRDMLTRKFVVGVFMFPCFVILFIFIYDLISFRVGLMLNPGMTIITSSSTLVALFAIGYFSYKLIDRQTRINRLWDNQYFRLHLDNFLSTNLQKEETSPFATLEQAKVNWANAVFKVKGKKPMTEKECVKHFREFLNLCYDKFEDKLDEKITKEQQDIYWEKLETWYKAHRTYSTRKQFRKELTQMMNDIQASNPPNNQSPITN